MFVVVAGEVSAVGVFAVTRGVSVTESARRGEFSERGGRSDSERLSLIGVELFFGVPWSALSAGLRRNAAPTIPISRMAIASPTCVSRFMAKVSGGPDGRVATVPAVWRPLGRVQLLLMSMRRADAGRSGVVML